MKNIIMFLVKKILFMTILIFCSSVFAQNLSESGGVERYAVFAGSNIGSASNQKLLYAGSDAQSFQKTMSEIGGIPFSNGILLLEPSKSDLDHALSVISEKILQNKEHSKRSEFLFYYSGHSDENALLLGKTSYDYSSLKSAISSVPSDVHVVILDSCYSGNFIRTKGGSKKKPFLIDDSSVVKGHAYLSSSSSQEFSQESDEIGSSFFTNAMLTGLRGAADTSGDKKVTLNELYSYAFSETLSKTENSLAGPQHPNYNITLVGSGDLVLSDISNSDSIVHLPDDLTGRVIIRDKNSKLVSEINKISGKSVYLALEKGEYGVTLIEEKQTKQGKISLTSGKVYSLSSSSLRPVYVSIGRKRGGEENEAESEEKSESANLQYEIENSDGEFIYVPVEFSLLNNEISRILNKKIVTTLSLGLLRSSVYETDGAMLSFGINETEILHGVQIGGLINRAEVVYGVQNSYIFNEGKDLKGVQIAGIFNRSHDFTGCQAAGIFNVSHDGLGAQFSGIFNSSRDNRGIQLSGIFNSAHNMTGLQASGILNTAGELEGVQVSGILNYSKELSKKGLQVGLINVAHYSDGIQIGLLNFSKNGVFEAGTSYTSNNNLRFSLNSGNKRLYTVLGASVNVKDLHKDDESEDFHGFSFAGLGTRLTFKMFNFDFEGIANFVAVKKDEAELAEERAKAKDEDDVVEYDFYFFPSFRFSAGFSPVKHLNIFAGVICSFEFSENEKAFDRLDTNFSVKNGDFKIHPEFEAGVKFKLN